MAYISHSVLAKLCFKFFYCKSVKQKNRILIQNNPEELVPDIQKKSSTHCHQYHYGWLLLIFSIHYEPMLFHYLNKDF